MVHVREKVIIIGGGLVGALCACFMAKRGYKVIVYELREDTRKVLFTKGRSINLALSHRGRKALKAVGLENSVLKEATPMKGRLIHNFNGKTKSVPYDIHTNQCIYSIGRNFLNQILITEGEKYNNLRYYFKHKLIKANINEGKIVLENLETNETFTESADLIIGADGAFSTLRRYMQQMPLFEFSQNYINHGYVELTISKSNGKKMISNHLHIWPRGQFMMIALPNLDKSWTLTLFMPFEKFYSLNNTEKLLDFFKSTFSDVVPLIGEENLIEEFFITKPSSLISIKCNPFYKNKFVLIGDAVHAMVPFYGQGMNAGFEDCWILDNVLQKFSDNFEAAIKNFSEQRMDNVHTICDLAMYNYEEMRDLVTHKSYYLRKLFDDFLFSILPDFWIPLYYSVTFSDMEYKKCLENRKWQNNVIYYGSSLITLLFSIIVCFLLFAL